MIRNVTTPPPGKLPVAPHYNIKTDHALRVFTEHPSPLAAKHLLDVTADELLSGKLGSRKAKYLLGVVSGYFTLLDAHATATNNHRRNLGK